MEQKPKLPRSVLVLNIIMIVLVLVICGLVISLLYSDVFRPEEETTLDISISTLADSGAESGNSTTTSATTTTTPKSSVSMTKRTTEATEPVTTPTESVTTPTEVESEVSSQPEEIEVTNTSYDKSFFENDLFIGDSITTGIYLYNKLPMKNVAAGVGHTPYKAYTTPIDLYDGTSATALEYAERMQPKRIYIMLGSNGLLSASAMEDSYRNLISKLNASCPNTVLYCISVSPVTRTSSLAASGGITNDMVVQFNTFIKGVCSNEGIKYIDLYSEISDSDGYFLEKYAEADGLHFKGITYDVMLSYIQSIAE